MTTPAPRSSFQQQLGAALAEDGGRIPVVVGLCGAGRTTALRRLHADLGPGRGHYIDIERTATTPERFLAALTAGSPFADDRSLPKPANPRQAFDAVLAFLSGARRPDQGPVTFLLDEVLEFQTFESFPGLRRALPELLAVIASSSNRFVLTSRYVARTARALASAPPQFVTVPVPGLEADEIRRMIPTGQAEAAADTAARAILGLSEGRPVYARAIVEGMASLDVHGRLDPVAALALLLEPGSRLALLCHGCYELRLHRARGYGALKAILEVLAIEQPLTLTEIAQRLCRTPGSTKDYLFWLEDVDLVAVHQKRYRFRDPLLRVWVRLHCRPAPPATEDIGREVQLYAAQCLPDVAPAMR